MSSRVARRTRRCPTPTLSHSASIRPERRRSHSSGRCSGPRGRVPLRFESRKTGKSGYAPTCANEWVPGHLRPESSVRCAHIAASCRSPTRSFDGICPGGARAATRRWRLPMLLDEPTPGRRFPQGRMEQSPSCPAVDASAWPPRSASFRRGGHVALFEQAIPASLARRLGSHLLTEAMENRPDIGLDSYDRLFPNQDTLPQGGFGNLIALPLQRAPRDQGNSVFVDDDLVPWTDQWAFLASVRRAGRGRSDRSGRGTTCAGRACVCLHRRTARTSPGPWHSRGVRARQRSSASCQTLSNSSTPIRYTSAKTA